MNIIEAQMKSHLTNFFKILQSAFLFGCMLISCARAQISRPNFVIIIGDDVGYYDIGTYGSSQVATPQIDRIAKEGIQFNNVFLTASSCSPSRASIISGRYPHNTGAAELHTHLSDEIITFPGLLRQQGYYTAASGKWHLGPHARKDFDKVQDKNSEIGEGGEDGWVETLRQCPTDKPFFLWLAAKDAHRPWEVNKFSGSNSPNEIKTTPALLSSKTTIADVANYYDEITRFDYFVGLIDNELKAKNVYENTVIIIMSDNGAPYPHAKARLYDQGMRTPFIIKWPEKILNPSVSDALISAVDIAPTIIDLAGLKQSKTFQGRSFANLLKNPHHRFRRYIFGEHNWHDFEALERSVRTKDYLYILNLRPALKNTGAADVVDEDYFRELIQAKKKGTLSPQQLEPFQLPRPLEELYYIPADSFQYNNVAADNKYKSQLKRHRQKLRKWKKQTLDTYPSELTPDWFDRDTGEPLSTPNRRGQMPGSIDAMKTNKKSIF